MDTVTLRKMAENVSMSIYRIQEWTVSSVSFDTVSKMCTPQPWKCS